MDIVVVAGQTVLTDVAIEYDAQSHAVCLSDLVHRPSPCGLRAVEEAIRIRERAGEGRVSVVSLGVGRIFDATRYYLAMGADDAICICDEAVERMDAYAMSACIAWVIRERRCDLVLCEGQTMDGMGGNVYLGPYVGDMLQLPEISGATSIELSQDGPPRLVAHRKLPRGDREVIGCPLPCVVSVEIEMNEPRYPSLPGRLEALEKPLVRFDLKTLALHEGGHPGCDSMIRLEGVSPPRARVKKGLVIDTALSAAERMRLTMAGGAAPKSTTQTMLTGETARLAQQIAEVAVRQGVIERSPVDP